MSRRPCVGRARWHDPRHGGAPGAIRENRRRTARDAGGDRRVHRRLRCGGGRAGRGRSARVGGGATRTDPGGAGVARPARDPGGIPRHHARGASVDRRALHRDLPRPRGAHPDRPAPRPGAGGGSDGRVGRRAGPRIALHPDRRGGGRCSRARALVAARSRRCTRADGGGSECRHRGRLLLARARHVLRHGGSVPP